MRPHTTRRFWIALALLALAMIVIPLVSSFGCLLRASSVRERIESATARALAERHSVRVRAHELLPGIERLARHLRKSQVESLDLSHLPMPYRLSLRTSEEHDRELLSLIDRNGDAFIVDVTELSFALSPDGRELIVGSHLPATRATTR